MSAPVSGRLFTPRFFLMCGFSFTVFLSAFQLLPTAPYRVLELGGTKFAAGLVLGFLTYASALSAPFTGALADRVGRRRTLLVASLVLATFAVGYALAGHVPVMLGLVLVHGLFWSGLMSGSAAYVLDIIPESRRAEGIAYWGIATTFSVAVAPSLGLWLFDRGWLWVCASIGTLNLLMAAIAWRLPDDRTETADRGTQGPLLHHEALEWRVTLLAVTLFLYCFGYGGITSFVALYSEASGVYPRGLFFAVFSAAIVCSRPFSGRLADRVGHIRVFVPCVLLAVCGYALLAIGGSKTMFVIAGIVFGLGFGSSYPVFAAYVMTHVRHERRGAAFGGILAALDTGIGTGSIVIGWLIEHHGYHLAYGAGAVVAALALPYFFAVRPVFERLVRSAAPTVESAASG